MQAGRRRSRSGACSCAAAHGGGPEGDLAAPALVVARLDGDALQVAGPGRVGVEVEQDVEDPLRPARRSRSSRSPGRPSGIAILAAVRPTSRTAQPRRRASSGGRRRSSSRGRSRSRGGRDGDDRDREPPEPGLRSSAPSRKCSGGRCQQSRSGHDHRELEPSSTSGHGGVTPAITALLRRGREDAVAPAPHAHQPEAEHRRQDAEGHLRVRADRRGGHHRDHLDGERDAEPPARRRRAPRRRRGRTGPASVTTSVRLRDTPRA